MQICRAQQRTGRKPDHVMWHGLALTARPASGVGSFFARISRKALQYQVSWHRWFGLNDSRFLDLATIDMSCPFMSAVNPNWGNVNQANHEIDIPQTHHCIHSHVSLWNKGSCNGGPPRIPACGVTRRCLAKELTCWASCIFAFTKGVKHGHHM